MTARLAQKIRDKREAERRASSATDVDGISVGRQRARLITESQPAGSTSALSLPFKADGLCTNSNEARR